jgi:hypothetical protein
MVLSPENGAVQINDNLLKFGRKTLYQETFGNEVFLTDIMGIVDGPLTWTQELMFLKGYTLHWACQSNIHRAHLK